MLIDVCLLDLIRQLELSLGDHTQVLFPELQLSARTDPNPAEVKNGNTVTYLSGYIDYGLFSANKGDFARQFDATGKSVTCLD